MTFMIFVGFSFFLQQTGPKGVIKDYQRFKQLERERREEQKGELAALTKKFAITCRTNVLYYCLLKYFQFNYKCFCFLGRR